MSKIVHLCLGNFFIDGASYQENMLAKYHARVGHEVTVIASLFTYGDDGMGKLLDEPTNYINSDGVKIIRLGYAHPLKYGVFFKKYIGFLETINAEKPDIVFCHNLQFGDSGILAYYLKNHPQVKLYGDNHGDYVNSARNWISRVLKHKLIWKYYVKKLEPYLTKVYGVSPMRCQFLREMYGINDSLIDFLPLGVDDELIPEDRTGVRTSIRQELGLFDGDLLIMTGGKIDERKNIHFLYDAFTRISDKRIHLAVCGVFTPAMAVLEKAMKKNSNVHLLGWCSADRVMNVMVASDFVCFPGTHSTLWEQSVGLGLPAIFKHWDGIDHVNINGNCIFVKGDDIDEIVMAISSMSRIEEYKLYKQLAEDASHSFLYSDIAKRCISVH